MKRIPLFPVPAAMIAGVLLLCSCDDWSGGDSFNSSGGAGVTNISGFYSGLKSGGKAVDGTSGGTIKNFTIQQSGNTLEIVDSQGSTYKGSVGSPNYVADLSDGVVENGALLSVYQVSWSGVDVGTGRQIEFSGTINLVTVSDVRGNTDTSARTSSSSNSSNTESTTTTTVDTSTPAQQGNFGQVEPAVDQVTTTTSTTGSTSGNTASNASGSTYTYSLTEANTQLRLRGTWVEVGGRVGNVDAIASGVQANLSSTVSSQP